MTNEDKNWLMRFRKELKDEIMNEIWKNADGNLRNHLDVKDAASATLVALTENGTVALNKAAEHPDMYEPWEAGQHYAVGKIRLYGDYLYQCRQEHDAQEIYPPNIIPALWERIPKPHEGEHDTPIPYDASVGMALTEGLYYAEDGSLYVCTRSSVNPVYGPLSGLVGIFTELAE